MPETFAIFTATMEHLEFLPAIERAAAAIFPPGLLPPDQAGDTVPRQVFVKSVQDGRLWVAIPHDETEPVGFALFRDAAGNAFLEEVDVTPLYGRRGIGRMLVLRTICGAREMGYHDIYLTTFRSVPWNAPFYQRLGFDAVPESRLPSFAAEILKAERDAGFVDRVVMRRACY